MICKFNWWNLPAKIKERLNIDLRYNWNRIPIELNSILEELKTENPNCYSQFFKPKEKFYWFTLPFQIEKLCNLIDCGEEPELTYNFDLLLDLQTIQDNYGIIDQATFIQYLEGQGVTNIIITDFLLEENRLACNLSFDGTTFLSFERFGITTIENLDSLVNLEFLYLNQNQITTIENLDSLVNLTQLDLAGNQITTIENLDSLVNLEFLELSQNQITTIEKLDSLVNLQVLYIAGNQITTIENLDSLVNLTQLDLLQNQITTIENLDSLVNLEFLSLSQNQITTIEFDKLNTWAVNAVDDGNIITANNIDNFNTSTTYTTLLNKGWSISL
jgi:hypothetical protein